MMTAIASNAENTPPGDGEHTDLPVGEILRRTRVHYGQTLDDVSRYLRIRASQLEALERGEIDKLPGRAYAIGYVRTYSEYLGLDGEKMIQLFKNQSGGRTSKPDLHFPVPASESKVPNFGVMIGSLAVLVLIFGVWLALNATGGEKGIDVSTVPDVPADIRVATAPAPAEVTTSVQVPESPEHTVAMPDGVSATAEPAATEDDTTPAADAADAGDSAPAAEEVAAPPEQKREITINVKERSWVEVRDQRGKVLLSRILRPGEVFIVPEDNYGLRLDTGNAGGIELLVNGEKLSPMGRQGDILRGLILDGPKLLDSYPPASR